MKGLTLKRILTDEGRLFELIRFGLVGGMATLLQLLFYYILVEFLNIHAVTAQIVSYILSFIYNFIASSLFTFRRKPNPLNALGFTASHAVNMGLQAFFVWLFVPVTGAKMAIVPAMLICIPINFLMIRFVFNSKYFQRSSTTQKV